MADVDDFKPRRRLKTYGKPSQKKVGTLSLDDAPPALFQDSIATTLEDEHYTNLGEKTGLSIQQKDQSTRLVQARKAGRGEATGLPKTNKKAGNLKHAAAAVFDVPSSEDEEITTSGAVTPRKRRRVTPARVTGSSNYLGNESHHRDRPLETGSEQLRPHSNPDALSNSLQTQPSQKRSTVSAEDNLTPAMSRPSSSDSQLSTSRIISSTLKGRKLSDLASAKVQSSKGIKMAPSHPLNVKAVPKIRGRSRTPNSTPSPRPQSEFTPAPTPKQSVLMTEILERDTAENSPSRIGFKGLTLLRSGDVSPGSGSADDGHISVATNRTEKAQNPTRPRGRLIDALGAKRGSDDASDSGVSDEDDPMASTEDVMEAERANVALAPENPIAEIRGIAGKPGGEPQTQSSQTSGSTITYSKQRSYLTETMLGGIDDLPLLVESDPRAQPGLLVGTPRDSFAPILEDDGGLEDAPTSGLRSIHELRQAGGNARVLGDIESILEDLEDASTSRRRAGLSELCTKLLDLDFTRQFLSSSMYQRFAAALEGEKDLIQNSLGAFANSLLLCYRHLTITDALACYSTVLKTCSSLLTEEREAGRLARERQFNMSRVARESLVELQQAMRQSRIWDSEPPKTLSLQVTGLRAIELAARRRGDLEEDLKSTPKEVIRQVIEILVTKASRNLEEVGPDDLMVVRLSLSILESYSTALGAAQEVELDVVQRLAKIGPLLSAPPKGDEKADAQIHILGLKLILKVTNNHPTLCERFSTPELIGSIFSIVYSSFSRVLEEAMREEESPRFDPLILALGSLINFTEWSETARKLISHLSHDSIPFLETLLQFFLPHHGRISKADSKTEIQSLIPIGYVSVLLCTSCISEHNRARVRRKMPGGTLEPLLGGVEYFLKVYADALSVKGGDVQEDKLLIGFIERLHTVVDKLRRADE